MTITATTNATATLTMSLISPQIDALLDVRDGLLRAEKVSLKRSEWATRNAIGDSILKIEQTIYSLCSCLRPSLQSGVYSPQLWESAIDGGRVMRASDSRL
jgi:hypothetical protein